MCNSVAVSVVSRFAVDMDIHGDIHGYIHGDLHGWISRFGPYPWISWISMGYVDIHFKVIIVKTFP